VRSIGGAPVTGDKFASDRPCFQGDSVVLAISVEKDGNLRVVYARIARRQAVLLGEVLKLQ
jgi:hypothetical protein